MLTKEFITYGCGDKFDISKFLPPKNKTFLDNKPWPGTGLWASPVDSEFGWRDFCLNLYDERNEDTKVWKDRLDTSFRFHILEDAKVYRFDSPLDFLDCPYLRKEPNPYFHCGLDFEEMAKDYDAVYLSLRGLRNCGWEIMNYIPGCYGLYGWDVETLLILNPKCIKD